MEQSLVSLHSPTAIHTTSKITSVPTNDLTIDQQTTDDGTSSVVTGASSDDVMDLLRAIEMSRLQAVRENEQNIYRPNNNHPNSTLNTNGKMNHFDDLQQAMELSLTTKNEQQLPNEATSWFSIIFELLFVLNLLLFSMYCISSR